MKLDEFRNNLTVNPVYNPEPDTITMEIYVNNNGTAFYEKASLLEAYDRIDATLFGLRN